MLWSGTAVANPTPSPAATVQSTALDISLADHTGRATLEFTAGTAIALDISGLEILEIASPNSQVKWTKTIPQLIVEPKGERPKLTIHYRFSPAENE